MKRFKEYLSKKELLVFCISLLVVMLSSFSYAFFLSVDNRDEDIVTTECFKSTFEDSNDINLDKAYPMSDAEGSRLTPYTFTIKNLCNKAGEYQVNIETKEESSLSTSYLRYKLDNYPSDILGNQLEVQEYINENIKESRAIDAGVILPNEEKTYNLRLWVDESSTVSQSANKLYKGKVVVKTLENKEPYQNIILHSNVVEIQNNEIVRVKQRKLGNLPEIQKVGYTFEGWFLEEEYINEVDENTIVTSEIDNLYAKVTPNTNTPYTVEHYQMDTDGNYPSEPFDVDNLEGTTDTQVTPTTRTYEGFTSPNAEEINIDGDGNKVLKYYYTRNRYTVTYSTKGIVTPASEELYYGELATMPTPIRPGYIYNGWFDAASGGNEYPSLYVVTGSTTMYAQYTEKTYTLTINPNSGSWGGTTSTSTRTLKYSDVLDIATPTRSSYTFLGWSQLGNALSPTGLTGISKYDWNSIVTVSTATKSSDNPLSGTSSEFRVSNPGTAASQPGLGGFVQQKSSEANKVYAHVFVAKVPVGYYLQISHNSLGVGGSHEWLTSNEGTGKWQTYVYRINSGSSGTFSTFGHVYATKDANNTINVLNAETGSYTIYLAYSNIFDITSNNAGIGQLDGSATLTATWAATVNNYSYTNSNYTYTVPANGTYKIELWGAEGGAGTNSGGKAGGKGAYTSGNISLTKGTNLYIYVGQSGNGLNAATFNGGGNGSTSYGSAAGGGATDVRLVNGTWSTFNSLKSRIMVAAGGGGGNSWNSVGALGADAGGLKGYNGTYYKASTGQNYSITIAYGATQTSGGAGGTDVSLNTYHGTAGSFGKGGNGYYSNGGSGGGSGYYGGGGAGLTQGIVGSGASGSSYISGYSGCKAITESSTASSISHSSSANHYSGKVFTSGVMIDGKGCTWASGSAASCGTNQVQPSGSKAVGHSGNGYARITIVSVP